MSTAAVLAQLAETGSIQVAIAAAKVTMIAAAVLAVPLGVFLYLAWRAAGRPAEPGCPHCDDGLPAELCWCLATCGRRHCPRACPCCTGDSDDCYCRADCGVPRCQMAEPEEIDA